MSYTLKAMLGMANEAQGEALVDTIDWAKWRNRALWAVGIVTIVIAVLWYFYKKDAQHEADKAAAVSKIETAPAPASKPFWKPKTATKQIAPKAINTPPMVEFGSVVQAPSATVVVTKKSKKPLSAEDAEFEKELDAMENELKKDEL